MFPNFQEFFFSLTIGLQILKISLQSSKINYWYQNLRIGLCVCLKKVGTRTYKEIINNYANFGKHVEKEAFLVQYKNS